MLARSIALLGLAAVISAGLGCGGADGDETDESEGALVETSKVGLRLAAFIPCEGVDGLGLYDGDGRSFSYAGAAQSSRVMLDATIDPDGPDLVQPKAFLSKKYPGSAKESGSGWCANLRDGARPDRTATASLDRVFATVTEQPDWQGYAVTRVRMETHARNPLLFFSPNLDAVLQMDIYYAREGGKKKPKYVTYAGYHDAFPSWELYVDQVPVIQHNALTDSNGPTDLIPGNEREQRGLCTRQAAGATAGGALWKCVAQ